MLLSMFKLFNFKTNFFFGLAVMINTLMEVFPLILISILLNMIESKNSIIEVTGLDLSNFVWITLLILSLISFGLTKFFIQYRINLFIESIRHIASLNILGNLSNLRSNQDGRLDQNAKKILSDTDFLVNSYSGPIGRIISGFTMVISVFLVLCYQNFNLAIMCSIGVFVPYLIIYLMLINKNNNIGKMRQLENTVRFQACLDILILWKESKVFNFENRLLEKFAKSSKSFYSLIALNTSLNTFPKYFLELFLTTIIFLYLLYEGMIGNTFGFREISLADFGIFIFAVLKLLPATNQFFIGFAMIRYGASNTRSSTFYLKPEKISEDLSTLEIGRHLMIDEIEYDFDKTKFRISNLTIKGKNMIVGESGCGKSSFIDILLGLKKSEKYEVKNQFGIKVSSDQIRNLSSICPQFPKFLDGSISENIICYEKIDNERMNRIIEICQLGQFDTQKFNENFQNSFSGGELQRIALARALYKTSKILILDEPTSALSESMGKEIMVNIEKYYDGILIIISHNSQIKQDSFNVIKFNTICKS